MINRKVIATFGIAITMCLTLCVVLLAQDDTGDPSVSYSYRLSEAQRGYSDAAASYDTRIQGDLPALNNSIDTMSSSRDRLAAQTDFMNNIGSLKTRADADQWVADSRKKWGADNGNRIGEVNPYNDTSYYRYYTNKSADGTKGGELAVSVAKGDYDQLQRAAQDWNQSNKRARDVADSLNNDYQQVADRYGKVTALRAQAAEATRRAQAVSDARQRVLDKWDISNYSYCPNGASWSACTHPAHKQEWINARAKELSAVGAAN